MNYAHLVNELRQARELLVALGESLDEGDWRQQYHPELSPPGWHLGHCAWTESYWLQEIVGGDDRHTRQFRALYTPTESVKQERGALLPPPVELLQWTRGLQSLNDDLLDLNPPRLRDHALMQDGYLLHFLTQHYSQHYESMLMVLAQRARQAGTGEISVARTPGAHLPEPATVAVEPGHYRVGGSAPLACDNELPQQQVTLGPYRIATRPVGNAAYLAFMQDGGYTRQELWSVAGWQWQQRRQPTCPEYWQQDDTGNWYGIAPRGAYALSADEPVTGVSHHEAEAYANWAGGRLPHEHQWEVACRLQLLEATGRAWEWCGNTFFPYAGFRAFPYAGYSQPWFDDRHYTLRGGSVHTRPSIRRASFRNFYPPGKRHIFAGLRLAYDTTA